MTESFEIKEAKREKTSLLISLAGESGAGKTYSALKIARGLVGDGEKIGFIDTENKRSHVYAEVTPFNVLDLDPPFSSNRYVDALEAFEKKKYKVVVIDSFSHEWEGIGGAIEQADAEEERTGRPGLHCWKMPKQNHKRLINRLLQSPMHIIFCLRARQKVAQQKNDRGKSVMVDLGLQPIAEKNFVFEMMVSVMLKSSNPGVPEIIKCPEELRDALPATQISTRTGRALAAWADSGAASQDDQFEFLSNEGRDAAKHGEDMLKVWWRRQARDKKSGKVSERLYRKLAKLKDDELKSIAAAAVVMDVTVE